METQTLRRFIVTLKKGVDYDSFYHDMETVTDNIPHIPNRAVAIPTWLPHSSRNTFYLLSDPEAISLKNDSRVLDVALAIPGDPEFDMIPHQTQTSNFTKSDSASTIGQGNYKNWGLLRCAFPTTVYGTSFSPSTSTYPYHIDGTGVDYVVCDTGIELNHPEFQDADGVSRIQQIDWLKEAGEPGTQSAVFYSDLNGHGTHVASTSAGKTFGWAKNARIYSMKIRLGEMGTYAAEGWYEIAVGVSLIRQWHENKPVDTVTGKKRPTVVNCSWGSGARTWVEADVNARLVKIEGGSYRGSRWYKSASDTVTSVFSGYGIPLQNSQGNTHTAILNEWSNAEIEELVEAGVHVCIAAGNDSLYGDTPSGPSYNDWFFKKHDSGLYNSIQGGVADGTTLLTNVRGWEPTSWPQMQIKQGDEILLIPNENQSTPKNYSHDTIYYTVTAIIDNNTIRISPGYNGFGITVPVKLSGDITSTAAKTTIINITPSTTGLTAGMVITKFSGEGRFGTSAPGVTNTVIVSVDSISQITILSGSLNTVGNITINSSVPGKPDVYVGIPIKYYYHRPNSPHSEKAIKVGSTSVKAKSATLDAASSFTNRGPCVNVWAPGNFITAAVSNTTAGRTTYAYNENKNFRQMSMSGTSMASPQVAGVVALYLQLNPDATTEEVKNFIQNGSAKNVMYDAGASVYTDYTSIMGAANRHLYFPYANSDGIGANVDLIGESGTINNLYVPPVAYTYDDWAAEYRLSNTEKLLGISIADFFYRSQASLGMQYVPIPPAVTTASASLVDVYGLGRKPDSEGLNYWTRRCLKESGYAQPSDTWASGDYQSTAFKKTFVDSIYYPRIELTGTITSTNATTEINDLTVSTGSVLYPTALLTNGMPITKVSGAGAFGSGTTVIKFVRGPNSITIESPTNNTIGSITFTAPVNSSGDDIRRLFRSLNPLSFYSGSSNGDFIDKGIKP